MKQLLVLLLSINSLLSTSFGQSAITDTVTSKKTVTPIEEKIYFPLAAFKDSIQLGENIIKLARNIIATYKESDKEKYWANSFRFNLVAGYYKQAADQVDSLQKIQDSKTEALHYKSYALAKHGSMKEGTSLDESYKKIFSNAFAGLTLNQKLHVKENFDTGTTRRINEGYQEIVDTLKKGTVDSISIKDAQELVKKYNAYIVINKIFPLTTAFTEAAYLQDMKPAIKSYKYGGAFPVLNPDEKPDPKMKYKLLIELTGFAYKGDSTAKKEMNAGLGEAARILNLHVASGVPKENIEMVIVVHGPALYAFLTNEKYKLKYELDNPNLPLIKEFQDFGAKFIACGQALYFFGLEKEYLVPGFKVSLTAQTVLSTYKLKNYAYYDLGLRE